MFFYFLFSFFVCFFPVFAQGNQSVAAFKTSLKAHANLCSVKELYWESRLWSKLVAKIHFNAFFLTHFVKIDPQLTPHDHPDLHVNSGLRVKT